MKFFMPASEAELSEGRYQMIRNHIRQLGPLKERRIYSLSFRHNGKKYKATVGEALSVANNEMVVTIFQKESGLFLVCTCNFGAIHGHPFMVGMDYDTSAVDFE